MSISNRELYKQIRVPSNQKPPSPVQSRAYRGLSTVNPGNKSNVLYDIALIKQDIINHFHIRQGEKLGDPEFGTIIWDAIYEPLTDQLKEVIADNVTKIVNSDPRVTVESINLESYESGLIIDCVLTYLPYNISESMRLKFDEDAIQLDN
jgi:phage baseplate assembly protein W|tara:strand:- start:69529 stop:69978 length:450 start_codon:yes stop_codon:yes gene_type:complete